MDILTGINNFKNNIEKKNVDDKNINNNKDRKSSILYWSHGNTGIKLTYFNKIMSNNLAKLFYIDDIFMEFINLGNKSKNSVKKLFNNNTNLKYSLKNGILTSNEGKVSIKINIPKINGNYDIIDAGFSLISNINIDEIDLKKERIPTLDSVISHNDNVNYILKITKIFNLNKKYSISTNAVNEEFNYTNIINKSDVIIRNYIDNGKKNRLLKSNINTAFYIRVHNNRGKAFIIDKENELIYYITENEDFTKNQIFIRYYILKINKEMKIIKY